MTERASRGGARNLVFRDRSITPIVGIALVIAVLSLAGIVAFVGSGNGPGSTILSIRGQGNKVSDEFTARPGWSVRWETSGAYFSYTIHGDVEFGQVVTQNGPGSGVTSPDPSGTFFVEVVAQGPWSITVIQGG